MKNFTAVAEKSSYKVEMTNEKNKYATELTYRTSKPKTSTNLDHKSLVDNSNVRLMYSRLENYSKAYVIGQVGINIVEVQVRLFS